VTPWLGMTIPLYIMTILTIPFSYWRGRQGGFDERYACCIALLIRFSPLGNDDMGWSDVFRADYWPQQDTGMGWKKWMDGLMMFSAAGRHSLRRVGGLLLMWMLMLMLRVDGGIYGGGRLL